MHHDGFVTPYPHARCWAKSAWIAGIVLATSLGTSCASSGSSSSSLPSVVYVQPGSQGAGNGTSSSPYSSLAAARDAIRPHLSTMGADVTVELEGGTYALSQPLTLTAADSGRNGHKVIYEAASGAHPVISGGYTVTGWHPDSSPSGIWVASVPSWLRTRQLYVDGTQAQVAQGTSPVTLTPTPTGYTASSPVMASWSNPSEIQFAYPSGSSNWTETQCGVASITGTAITMDQPCWDNSTLRTTPGTTLYKFGWGLPLNSTPVYPITTPMIVSNALELLTKPGQWYLDDSRHLLYYMPLAGQDMGHADVVAPNLQTLVQGTGTPTAPIHDIEFRGIQFSYATWLEPSTPDGYSDLQAGTYLTGANAFALQGACDSPQATCPFASFPQMPGNVTFQYDRGLVFDQDTFVHLGAAGLALGDGSQNDLVQGNLFTDTSGSGLTVGGIDQPLAQGGGLTSQVQVLDNYFHNIAVDYPDCAAIFVGYAQYTTISHNQIDDVPYSGISIGWGGWLASFSDLAAVSNYSQGNVISDNLIFDEMKVLVDGGGIYSNGIQGSSMSNAETIEGNVVLDQHHPSWAIYTDNGSEFINVENNVVFDAIYVPLVSTYLPGVSPDFSFGGCGQGPIVYSSNYSIQSDPSAGLVAGSGSPLCGGKPLQGVSVASNYVIASLSQVPPDLLANAGLEPAYRTSLSPDPVPSALSPYHQFPQ